MEAYESDCKCGAMAEFFFDGMPTCPDCLVAEFKEEIHEADADYFVDEQIGGEYDVHSEDDVPLTVTITKGNGMEFPIHVESLRIMRARNIGAR